jgi:hypothetical protein|tara:strand:+ start:716 stop:859 length:144 start_codon:yes stop_codon:yes gene_type:complete
LFEYINTKNPTPANKKELKLADAGRTTKPADLVNNMLFDFTEFFFLF